MSAEICCVCGDPATCVGRYEAQAADQHACDKCCGHGNEDGHCVPVPCAVQSVADTAKVDRRLALQLGQRAVMTASVASRPNVLLEVVFVLRRFGPVTERETKQLVEAVLHGTRKNTELNEAARWAKETKEAKATWMHLERKAARDEVEHALALDELRRRFAPVGMGELLADLVGQDDQDGGDHG